MFYSLRNIIDKALNHKGFRKYFANTSWMFAEQLLRMIAGLFVGIWVARYLGPEQYGIFSYVIAFVAIFSSFAKLGLDSIVVRNLVNTPQNRDVYLGTAFWLKLFGAIFALIVIFLATIFTSNDHNTNLYILIIAAGLIFQSFEVVEFYFQSKVMSKFVSICKIIQLLTSSIFKIYLVLSEADLIWFVLVSFLDQATLALTFYLAYKYQKLNADFHHFNFRVAILLIRDSWPLILSGFVLMIQARADQLMLKEMVGNIEVGYYSSAIRLVEVFSLVPTVISMSLFPAIINARKISMDLYNDRLFALYKLMMFLFLIVAFPIWFFGDIIILFLYKEAYAPAGEIFSLMALRLFFTNYGVVRSAFLITENLMVYSLIVMLIGMLVNLILNYLWIPTYYSVGAVWASLISFLFVTFLIDLFYKKTRANCIMMIKSMLIFSFRGAK